MKLHTERLAEIANQASLLVDNGSFSNIEWQIQHQGADIDRGNYGYADALTKSATPSAPIYRIYSMTKPVIAVAALMLVEQGKLLLPAPVAAFLPKAADASLLSDDGKSRRAECPMLIEHLFTHRAGFSYDFLPECRVAGLYREQSLAEDGTRTLEQLVAALMQTPLSHEPGTAWRYSYSIDVLAHILELICDKPLQALLQDLVFDPCNMPDTGFAVATENQSRLMPMFGQRQLGEEMSFPLNGQPLKRLDVEKAHPSNSDQFARGGHGLYSTASDYMNFMQVLVNGLTPSGQALLSTPMVEFMWANRIPASMQPMKIGPNALSGYGWNLFGRVVEDRGQCMFLTGASEGGWAGAASTYFWVDPGLQLNGVVMTQYLGSSVPLGDLMRTAAYQTLAG